MSFTHSYYGDRDFENRDIRALRRSMTAGTSVWFEASTQIAPSPGREGEARHRVYIVRYLRVFKLLGST